MAAVIGRPNAGKSSLVNALVGEKVSIVSPKPQTTRNGISGILNTESGGEKAQIIFADTPGIFNPRSLLDAGMAGHIRNAAAGADVIVYVIDGSKPYGDGEAADIRRYMKYGVPVIAAVNKSDITGYGVMYPRLAALSQIKDLEIMPVSALKKANLDKLSDMIISKLPEGEPVFDEDDYTDKSMKFMAAEAVREKALLYLNEEIPHGIGVEIREYADREKSDLTDIVADIVCEKDSHKQIIIGKGGNMLKKIGAAARADIERFSGRRVNLQLFVKVRENWRDDAAHISQFSGKN